LNGTLLTVTKEMKIAKEIQDDFQLLGLLNDDERKKTSKHGTLCDQGEYSENYYVIISNSTDFNEKN